MHHILLTYQVLLGVLVLDARVAGGGGVGGVGGLKNFRVGMCCWTLERLPGALSIQQKFHYIPVAQTRPTPQCILLLFL